MREFSFPTVSQLVREVKNEGIPRFSRSTFYRMVKRYQWLLPKRTAAGWRRFDEDPASPYSIHHYKELIKKAYGLK